MLTKEGITYEILKCDSDTVFMDIIPDGKIFRKSKTVASAN